MNQFYVSIIFTGIMLILVSIGMIAYDRKKAIDYGEKLDKKSEELENIISDADQMINEMNKFSDYIVTQMELKNEELSTSIKAFEEKCNKINVNIEAISVKEYLSNDVAVNGNNVEELGTLSVSSTRNTVNKKEENASQVNSENINNQLVKNQNKAKVKVVPINNKYTRVLQLYQNGMSDTEIAKTLNMGKGEVQLILEMNK